MWAKGLCLNICVDLLLFYFLSSASSSNLKTINAFFIFSGAVGVSEFDSNNGFRTVTRDPMTSFFKRENGFWIPDYQ